MIYFHSSPLINFRKPPSTLGREEANAQARAASPTPLVGSAKLSPPQTTGTIQSVPSPVRAKAGGIRADRCGSVANIIDVLWLRINEKLLHGLMRGFREGLFELRWVLLYVVLRMFAYVSVMSFCYWFERSPGVNFFFYFLWHWDVLTR